MNNEIKNDSPIVLVLLVNFVTSEEILARSSRCSAVWVPVGYQEETGRCPHFEENYKD